MSIMHGYRNAIVEQDVRSIAARDLPWAELEGCRVVVTGAGGFLGGYLVRTLLALHRLNLVSRPVQVIALARDTARVRVRLADVAGDPQLDFLSWDFNDIAIPELGDVHYILHAASQASPRFYGTDPVGTFLPNTVGTAALLAALKRSACSKGLLFVSSSEVYGAVTTSENLTENAFGIVNPTQIRACYAEGKRAGETLCVAFHHQHHIPTWIVRPFHTYGPGLTPEDGRVFSDFAYNVLHGEHIVMHSNGAARRAFCYVSDAIAGFFTVLFRGQPGVACNVANAAGEMSIMDLAEMLAGLYPEKKLRVERRFESAGPDYVPSPYSRLVPDTALIESLGWHAEILPPQGFRRMIEGLDHG